MFLNGLITTISSFKNVIGSGDINIPINFSKLDQNDERYLSIVVSLGLLPAHIEITRESSKTYIDHTLLKTRYPAVTLIPRATLTDNYLVLFCLTLKYMRSPTVHNYIFVHCI